MIESTGEMAEGSRKKETEKNNMSAWLAWKELTVSIPVKKNETHYVLEGVTGYAEPGTLTALMGPSGSGKSTLLDALAGRLSASAVLLGTILLNGQKFRHSYGTIAYVTQQDDLIGTLTVRETISYSAQLRLPDNMPFKEKQALVEDAITEMGLQECADIVVGNWHLRGISGGEKRRLSIALEILMRPRLLFLDEPTSGLDSASAFFIIQTLWGLAREGRTVVASVHQPSSQIFELFDQLFLLSGGKTVFFGKASEANEFFAQSGFPCPCRRNPADHFLRNINSDYDKIKVIRNIDPLDRLTAKETTQILINHYKSSKYSCIVKDKVEEISKIQGLVFQSAGSQASFLRQCFTLTKRSFVNMSRDLAYYWLRLIIFVSLSVGIGIMYYNVGTKYNSIMARGASAYFSIGFSAFMSIGGFPSFVEDMKVFRKERLNGYYGVATFIISNTFSAMPFLLMISFLSGTVCYFLVHLHPGFSHYLFFILCFYATITTIESLMMAIASVVPNFLMGIVIGAGIQGIFMMVSGSIFFRLPHDIPKPFWRYPMMYTSLHFWAVQGLYQNDLKGLVFDNERPEQPKITGEYLLKNVFQISMDRSKWLDLSAIFSMIIIYRILCYVMINISEGLTPYLKAYMVRRRLKHKGNITHKHDK